MLLLGAAYAIYTYYSITSTLPAVDDLKEHTSQFETTRIYDRNGRLLVQQTDGMVQPAGFSPRDNFGPYTVPPGSLFMMGDNRDNSNDSRFWGPVEMDLVKGHAMFIYWSWDKDRNWPRFQRLYQAIR